MKLNIRLNPQSIQSAINALKTAENTLRNKMFNELITACAEQIKSFANDRLSIADIGSNVKVEIMSSWVLNIVGKTAKLTNTADKAAYVEFGVGIVGQQKPHDNAAKTGYQYNMPSKHKLADGTWLFTTTYDDLDLPKSAIIDKHYGNTADTLVIETKGTPATMYAYNAVVDFVSGNYAKKIWNDIKIKYWG